MKKLLSIFSLGALLIAASCSNDDYGPTIYEYVTVGMSGTTTEILEDAGEPLAIPIAYGGTLKNPSAFTVNYTITGGEYGADYTIVGGSGPSGTVTIPAGATGEEAVGQILILPTADRDVEDNVDLTITLDPAASNGLKTAYPGFSTIDVTIEDDDCAYDQANFVGTAAGREFYDDGSTYPTDPEAPGYDVGITSTGTDAFEMDNFWGSSYHVSFTVDPVTLEVTVPDQDIEDDYHVKGTGKVSTCGKTITIDIDMDGPGYTGTFKNVYTFE